MNRAHLFILSAVLVAGGGLACGNDDGKTGGGGTEGESEGALVDSGVTDALVDSGPPDLGPEDLGFPDSGIDEWENRVKIKDGISAKVRAEPNPIITVMYTRPVNDGASRRLCYWRGTAPDEQTENDCLNLHVGNPSNPSVSTDGNWVTFYEAGGASILLADLTTKTVSTIRKIGPAEEVLRVQNPVISRDASFMAFQAQFQGSLHIIRMDRTRNNEEVTLWNIQGATGTPSISEDGQIVVFHADPGGNNDVFRWSQEVRDSTNLSKTPEEHEKDPRISANGDVVCFRQGPQAEGTIGHITVVSNGVSRDITSSYRLKNLNNFDCAPTATGRHIVFRSLPGNGQRTSWMKSGYFYIYDLNADTHRQLPDPAAADRNLVHSVWRLSSDGRWIVFTAVPLGGDKPDVWLLEVASGHYTRIVQTPEAEGTGAPAIN